MKNAKMLLAKIEEARAQLNDFVGHTSDLRKAYIYSVKLDALIAEYLDEMENTEKIEIDIKSRA